MKSNLTLTALSAAFFSLTPGLIRAAQPTTVYAGTVTGIVQSNDGGAHWSSLATIGPVWSLAIDPTNPNNMYAGSSNAVYTSTDGGNHWTAQTNGISTSESNVTALVIDPSTPSTVYAGTGNFGNGVYKSTDSGKHWTAINTGLMKNASPGSSLDVHALAIDPINTGTLYVTGDTGLYTSKTTNGGASWFPLQIAQGFGYAVAVDPVNTGTVYMDGFPGGAVTTTGGGNPPSLAAWSYILPQTSLFDSLTIDPSNHGTVYAGSAGCYASGVCNNAIYKSSNGVFSATPVGSLGGTTDEVRALAVDPVNPETVYAGSEDGVHISTNGGTTWTLSYAVKDAFVLAMKPNGTQGLFFNEMETGAKELFAGLAALHSPALSCAFLQGYEEEVQVFVDFGWLSGTQGQALIAQTQGVAATVPCQ